MFDLYVLTTEAEFSGVRAWLLVKTTGVLGFAADALVDTTLHQVSYGPKQEQ